MSFEFDNTFGPVLSHYSLVTKEEKRAMLVNRFGQETTNLYYAYLGRKKVYEGGKERSLLQKNRLFSDLSLAQRELIDFAGEEILGEIEKAIKEQKEEKEERVLRELNFPVLAREFFESHGLSFSDELVKYCRYCRLCCPINNSVEYHNFCRRMLEYWLQLKNILSMKFILEDHRWPTDAELNDLLMVHHKSDYVYDLRFEHCMYVIPAL